MMSGRRRLTRFGFGTSATLTVLIGSSLVLQFSWQFNQNPGWMRTAFWLLLAALVPGRLAQAQGNNPRLLTGFEDEADLRQWECHDASVVRSESLNARHAHDRTTTVAHPSSPHLPGFAGQMAATPTTAIRTRSSMSVNAQPLTPQDCAFRPKSLMRFMQPVLCA
jgi:hypothetical protein